jgi:hypothetical protein
MQERLAAIDETGWTAAGLGPREGPGMARGSLTSTINFAVAGHMEADTGMDTGMGMVDMATGRTAGEGA